MSMARPNQAFQGGVGGGGFGQPQQQFQGGPNKGGGTAVQQAPFGGQSQMEYQPQQLPGGNLLNSFSEIGDSLNSFREDGGSR